MPHRPGWDDHLLWLDTPRGVPTSQPFDFCEGGQIAVPDEAVLEAQRGNGEVQGRLVRHTRVKAINQHGGQRVATPDAIHHIRDVITAAQVEICAVIQASRPAVMAGAEAFPQGDGLVSQIWESSKYQMDYLPRYTPAHGRQQVFAIDEGL